MTVLEEFGLSAGEPYIKNIEGDLWELRPINDRVLFLVWYENSFIMLHHFVKKTADLHSSYISHILGISFKYFFIHRIVTRFISITHTSKYLVHTNLTNENLNFLQHQPVSF